MNGSNGATEILGAAHLGSTAASAAASLAIMRQLGAGLGAGLGMNKVPAKLGNKMAPPVPSPTTKVKNLDNLRVAISNLETMLHSDSSDVQLEATKKFRQLLSIGDNNDPIGSVQDMLDNNIVPQLLRFLEKNGNAALQVEALWALTNIAAGTTEHTKLLIKYNAVPTLVALLDSTHQEVLEQAVWVLGNIAGDSATARDKVLEAGALGPLLKCMCENRRTSLLRIATWTLSNLCDLQPRPVFKVDTVLQTLRVVLQNEDTEVLSHACWALSHLCDGPSPHIQAVVKANVCYRLVGLLHNKSWRVVKPALRTVGNIVCAEEEQDYTQQIIDCGAVPCLQQLIGHSNREIQKEACWTLSNIAAGTIDQIQCVLDSGSIPTLIELASKHANTDPDVRIEACWVLLNATSCGSDSQIQFLVNSGCISVLCTLLDDNSMVMMALEGLEKILQVGEDSGETGEAKGNALAALLDTAKIEALQRHRSTTIAKRAAKMWKQHFVVCAICHTPYSRNSPETKFCAECKCSVCKKCDCSVYHLSYQDALWKDLAEGELMKQNKKTKKTKKGKGNKTKQKQRAKEKKAAELEQIKQVEKAKEAKAKKSEKSEKPSEAKAQDPKSNEEGSITSVKDPSNSSLVGATADDVKEKVGSQVDLEDPKAAPSDAATKAGSKEGARQESTLGELSDNMPSGATASATGEKLSSSLESGLNLELIPESEEMESSTNTPDYVEFLSNNGSILDLWKLINENEATNAEESPSADTSLPLQTST
eukprot:CAMPEP_0184508464 /NCGR_PEP_ID=MMETSP0198_2-20121128/776_1 /TAXON_ID=1112570 /ORGANISM="Thraustochytrium sp., Strain LLF1b" /LENGTH=763 /DNA_ID=CAMNT_0026898253 /DNA_START=767 /DNA_END=3058 /DNA_ORIENTATION=+